MNDIMLDLETMGTDSNAAIIAIGAVKFNDLIITDNFYITIDLKSSVNIGLNIDADTVLWWLQQSQEAREEFKKGGSSIESTLDKFAAWVGDDPIIWGNGSDFDNVILANAYKKADIRQPWSFRNNRCFRTVKAINDTIELERVGIVHNALNDAINQAKYLIRLKVL